MNVVAVARPCPHCGTLVTCSGEMNDAFLRGACVVDGVDMTVAHNHPARGSVNHGAPSRSEADAKMPEFPPTITGNTPAPAPDEIDTPSGVAPQRVLDPGVVAEPSVKRRRENP